MKALRSIAILGSAVMFILPAFAQSTQFGQCVTTTTRSVLFAPGTPQSEIDRIVAKIRRHEGSIGVDYQADARWSLTSYGNTGAIGTACRFGYSFVSDGVEVPDSGLGGGPSNLQSTLTSQFGSSALWRQKFRQMFDAWGAVSGLQYDEVSDDGAPLHFFPGQIGRRGDLRISGVVLLEPNVLAYNFFPDNGDMVINTQHSWGSQANDYRFLRNTLGHEHGHGMGLGHVIPLNDTKLMEPVLTTAFDGPQNDDIQGCQFLYGDRVEDNDGVATATDLGQISSGQSVELLAIERPSDRDWFRVEIPAGFSLTVRVEPQGGSYLVGPQGGFPSLRNANAINDLRLSAYLADGTTLLGTSNIGGLGFPETLQSIARPSNGIVTVKVDVSTIAEDIQRYRMIFLLDGATTTFSPNSYFLISGNEIGGGLFGLQASDDFRLKLYPRAQSQQQRAYIDYEVSTTSTILNPTSIVVGYEGSAASVNVLRTMYAYDYVAGAWVQVSQSQSTTLETTQEVALTNPARFVSASGQMRVRVRNIANGPIFGFPYETATDWVYWRLTQ
jgi:hypothetical protein